MRGEKNKLKHLAILNIQNCSFGLFLVAFDKENRFNLTQKVFIKCFLSEVFELKKDLTVNAVLDPDLQGCTYLTRSFNNLKGQCHEKSC